MTQTTFRLPHRVNPGFALSVLLAATLGGCALPDKPVRPQAYDLGPALPVAASAQPSGSALALAQVMAPPALDGHHIIYRLSYSSSAQQPQPYAHARWAMSPPHLVEQRLREALAATRPVVANASGLAQVELRIELDEFMHDFSAPDASEGVVRLRATAIAPMARTTRTDRLLGQHTFVSRQPAPTADAAGGASALRQATDDVVQQTVNWVNGLTPPSPN
ncbi:ABC-type transport auxiliary lipoprotein family protein [Ottowia sp.]|uniref:ABC-type transport auxiliary lipoprotein family protein n=1 Tax=Ottowia sp. TaxID=1898956 RepID=UPI003A87AFE2